MQISMAWMHLETHQLSIKNPLEAAGKSLDWYENVASKMDLDPITFAYDYMRRTDQVSHEDLKLRDPRFTAAYEALCRAQPPVASKRATALQLQGG